METVDEGFTLISTTQTTTEVKDCIIIFKGKLTEEFFQFLKAGTDFRWVAFMGLCIGLVKLIQNSFTITVPRVKGMGFYVGFQLLTDLGDLATISVVGTPAVLGISFPVSSTF